MKFSISIPFSECLWGDPDDFSKFIYGIVFQWYHLNTILSINWLLIKIIYIILQLNFNCQQPPPRRNEKRTAPSKHSFIRPHTDMPSTSSSHDGLQQRRLDS